MSQIGDIAPGAEPVDHASGLLLNLGYRREKLYRIVIALQCNAISRHFPGIFRTHGPVQAKGVCPAFECHSFECVPRSFCKENDGYIFLDRSEEHTSELQSRGHLVCRLLLEKKKKYHYC